MLGSPLRTPPAIATLANGALPHAFDFGDAFDAGPAHPKAALIAAPLALADAEPTIDGARFVAAIALEAISPVAFCASPARRSSSTAGIPYLCTAWSERPPPARTCSG